jgi:hypothetical protein
MKKYCFNCGAKIEFLASNKPKFCPNCGAPLESSKGQVAPQVDTPVEIEDDISDFQTDIQGLDFDFDEKSLQQKGEKLGSVVGTLDESQAGQLDNDIPQSELPKYGVKDLEREAGSLRRKKPEGDA